MKRLVQIIILLAVLFSSCATMRRDIVIDRQREQMNIDLAEVESLIVPLEAAGGQEARRRQGDIAAARRMISGLESDAAADPYLSGRLTAWSGRLAILEGRYSEAVRLHRQSQAAGNVPSIILGIRLEGDPEMRLAIIESELALAAQPSDPGFGELHIEKGRSLLELNRFIEAAGAFDTAFASDINDVYRESYLRDRNRAWEMRNIGDAASGTIGVLGQDSISWNDSIALASNETQLLRFISGGRSLTETEFFNRLLERGFIPYSQDVNIREWPAARPGRNDMVTRAGAAWFAWNLYAEARADRTLLTRYSSRFATGPNPRSPIADIPPHSPFFDSILGCVETELIHLIDGRNFMPAQPIRGAELLAILRRLDN